MAATTRLGGRLESGPTTARRSRAVSGLARAALALAALFVTAAASADQRVAGRSHSLAAAFAASDTALIGLVVAVREQAGSDHADVRVLETLRGAALPQRITVVAAGPAALEDRVSLRAGATMLLLATRAGDRFAVSEGLAVVPIASDDDRDAARALIRAYVAGGAALDAQLRKSATIETALLRRGVLEDLSHRLVAGDGPFLLQLAAQRDAPEDARLFAIIGLGAVPDPLPESLAELLQPDEPPAIRKAALNAYAARGQRARVERGLDDPDARVREVAVNNLADAASVAALERHFGRESERAVQLAIVRQLGLIGTDPSRAALERMVARSGDPAIRRAAEPWLGVRGAR